MLLLICLLLFSIYLNFLNTKHIESIAKKKYHNEFVLHDIGHNILPHISNNVDLLINFLPFSLSLYSFVFLKHNANEIISSLIAMIILRIIANRITILPKCNQSCDKVTLLGGCHDQMFSGHTAITILFCLFMYEHNKNLLVPSVLIAISQIFLIISTKSHYSILESSIKVDDLIDRAVEDNRSA
mgnify:CR=1 FL=1